MIIGVTGLNGAGKTTLVDYFINKGFRHLSVRNYLSEALVSKGLEINRDNFRQVANEIRSKHGTGFIVRELIIKNKDVSNIIMESIRNEGEIDALQTFDNFILVGIVADSRIRYNRIVARGSQTDKVTYEQFLEQEKKEMKNTDPSKQNLFGCIKRADIKIVNDGSLDEFKAQIDNVFKDLVID